MSPKHAQLRPPRRLSRFRTAASLALVTSLAPLIVVVHSSGEALAVTGETRTVHVKTSGSTEVTRGLSYYIHKQQRKLERQQTRELIRERHERAKRRAARQERRDLSRWIVPINGATLSAPFGEAGSAWSSGYHTGQDFSAPYGTPVLAAGAGTITFAGWSDAYGNKIEITHPDGNQTWYAHMSSFARTSGSVVAGDVIGYVGCTGNCFGNHLHFEFHPGGGAATDPMDWLRSQGAL